MRQFDLRSISQQAVNSRIISREVNILSGKVYYLIILLTALIEFSLRASVLLSSLNINPAVLYLAPAALIPIGIIASVVLVRRWLLLPRLVYLTDIYLLSVQGEMGRPTDFDSFETAILQNDWVTARYYALSAFRQGLFGPAPAEIVY